MKKKVPNTSSQRDHAGKRGT